MNSLRFKPCNADHTLEVRAIVALFEERYGSRYPYPEVYNEHFWKTRVNRDFISLVAFEKDKAVAHVAVRFEGKASIDAYLLFIALSPELKEDSEDVLNQIWAMLPKFRQWPAVHAIFAATAEPDSKIDTFLQNTVGAHFCALLAGYGKTEQGRHTLALYAAANSPIVAPKMRIPLKYQSAASAIYAQYGITPIFADSGKPELRAVSADIPAIERIFNHSLGLEQMLVSPSLISENIDFNRSAECPRLLYIDGRDPKCGDMVKRAEESGYVFTGFIPYLRGKHFICFSSMAPTHEVTGISSSEVAHSLFGEIPHEVRHKAGANSRSSVRGRSAQA